MFVDTYPDFRIDPERVAAAITPRTKVILLNSPANPTGAVAGEADVRALAELAAKHNIALISDEIYRAFCYDAPFASPTRWNDQTIVIDGFSKTYGVTGWRLGFVHGPAAIIEKMTMLQQYTFVCCAASAAMGGGGGARRRHERARRRLPPAPRHGRRWPGRGRLRSRQARRRVLRVSQSARRRHRRRVRRRAIDNELLIIPGNIFSRRDTHFRISYAASDATIERGLDVLRKLR